MTPKQKIQHIVSWTKKYAKSHKIQTLVVGVSGGIDSAVVSALCAKTGLPVIALSMPILQSSHTHNLSVRHCEWLKTHHDNVSIRMIDLSKTFKTFSSALDDFSSELASANSRARLRMTCLYQVAQSVNGIVVGTGNRVEDFGVGFFTKYGDGGVDISPIGDCMKTEVWEMGRELTVLQDIIDAAPTDGLWADDRIDESQLGMTYPELEEAMRLDLLDGGKKLNSKERSQLHRYREIRARNMHKMQSIPVCQIPVE